MSTATADILQPQESRPRRALALDALRGLAIFTMCFSGLLRGAELPGWMYHAQVPPPDFVFEPIPGYTWVDLVFPAFLFSMGVAFPFALSSRLERGVAIWRIVLGILMRGVGLGFFALYVAHMTPWQLRGPEDAQLSMTMAYLLALLAFGLLFLVYMRFPKQWPDGLKWGLRIGGIALALVWMLSWTYSDGTGFRTDRNDIIIVLLTNSAVSGSLIWLVTRNNLMMRLGAMAIAYVLIESSKVEGSWTQVLAWSPGPISWLYQLGFHSYLMVVIPGTIVGDLLLRWMRERDSLTTAEAQWAPGRLAGIAAFALGLVVFLHIGLQARWEVATPLLTFVALAGGWMLFSGPVSSGDRLLRAFFGWAAFWLVLGLAFEPHQGGIKKDPATMSYFFVSTGLSILLLICLTVAIDRFGKRRWFNLLILSGQNPMLAYMGIRNLLPPIFGLTYLDTLAGKYLSGWVLAAYGFFKSVVLIWLASIFTRLRMVWRT